MTTNDIFENMRKLRIIDYELRTQDFNIPQEKLHNILKDLPVITEIDLLSPDQIGIAKISDWIKSKNFGENNEVIQKISDYLFLYENNPNLPISEMVAGLIFNSKEKIEFELNVDSIKAILNFLVLNDSGKIRTLANMNLREGIKLICRTRKRILMVSNWGYPFGGAEACFSEAAAVLNFLGFHLYWCTFDDPKTGSHPLTSVKWRKNYLQIDSNLFPEYANLTNIIESLAPSMLLTHGELGRNIEKVATKLNIPIINGYHFWHGLIDISKVEITNLVNKVSDLSLYVNQEMQLPKGSNRYLVSDYMQEIYRRCGGIDPFITVNPIINTYAFEESTRENSEKQHVLQTDLSVGKGGWIFCKLAEKYGHKYKFIGVKRETTDEEILIELQRLKKIGKQIDIVEYSSIQSLLGKSKILLVPSNVDETFSRVTVEAIQARVVVLASRYGNLPNLLNTESCLEIGDFESWESELMNLMSDMEYYEEIQKIQSVKLDFLKAKNPDLVDLVIQGFLRRTVKNIGIFSVNSAQGLATLAETTAYNLRELGYETHLLAFQSYYGNEFHCNNNSNSVYESVVYTNCLREDVSELQMRTWVIEKKIDLLIVPEVCWDVNWDRLFKIRKNLPDLLISTIPMLEIQLRSEIKNLSMLDCVFFPTYISKKILNNSVNLTGHFIGTTATHNFHINQNNSNQSKFDTINFLHIAGHNPEIRKNTITVIREFIEASKKRSDIRLTITLQSELKNIDINELPSEITIIRAVLQESEIIDLYKKHDVSVQISSHEGIGLGFVESLAQGVPVITLDCSPHNEFVKDNQSGWLLRCSPFELTDNVESLIKGYKPVTGELVNLFLNITKQEIFSLKNNIATFVSKTFSEQEYQARLLEGVQISNYKIRSDSETLEVAEPGLYVCLFNFMVLFTKKHIYPILNLNTHQKYLIKKKVMEIHLKILELFKFK